LESTSEGLKEIAISTGFRDELNLRRAFGTHLGISPRDYRKQIQGKALDKVSKRVLRFAFPAEAGSL
jgi:transcriptional regulator GlxA family with amidase domain